MKINGTPDGGGKSAVIEGLTITSNGTYTAESGVDGYSPVEVDVPAPEFVTETLSVSSNGTYTPSEGVNGYSQVNVNVPAPEFITETLSVSANGTYTPSEGVNGYSQVNVNVPAPEFVTETLSVSANGTYTPSEGVDGYSQIVVDVPQSVTGYTEKEITEGIQIVNLSNSASYVNSNAFAYNTYLQTVNLPNCYNVYMEAFAECNTLTTINLPACTIISDSAFRGCKNLKTINIPLCSHIGSYAFYMWSNFVSELNLSKCIYIGNYAFTRCYSLATVNVPICKNISSNAFSGCSSLNSLTLCTDVYWTIPYNNDILSNTPIMSGTGSIYVRSDTYSAWITSKGWSSLSNRFVSVETSGFALSFSEGTVYGTTKLLYRNFSSFLGISKSDINKVILPECNYIEGYTFSNCSALSQISLPRYEYISNYTFYECTSLNSINLPICSYIGEDAFKGCTSLSIITIGYSSICSLYGSIVFDRTKITSSIGSIYVPTSLVDSYKSANKWSYFSTQIFPIPE